MTWDSIGHFTESITFDWLESIEPTYVEQHPIGPQRKHQELLQQLVNGNSFAVVAPRRFGKSTLVEYLFDRASKAGLLTLRPIVCTSLMNENHMDYQRVWRDVAKQLTESISVGLSEFEINDIPGPNAFDPARHAAAQRGYRGIVILIDEAQLFFDKKNGHYLGDRLKDRLERD